MCVLLQLHQCVNFVCKRFFGLQIILIFNLYTIFCYLLNYIYCFIQNSQEGVTPLSRNAGPVCALERVLLKRMYYEIRSVIRIDIVFELPYMYMNGIEHTPL